MRVSLTVWQPESLEIAEEVYLKNVAKRGYKVTSSSLTTHWHGNLFDHKLDVIVSANVRKDSNEHS